MKSTQIAPHARAKHEDSIQFYSPEKLPNSYDQGRDIVFLRRNWNNLDAVLSKGKIVSASPVLQSQGFIKVKFEDGEARQYVSGNGALAPYYDNALKSILKQNTVFGENETGAVKEATAEETGAVKEATFVETGAVKEATAVETGAVKEATFVETGAVKEAK